MNQNVEKEGILSNPSLSPTKVIHSTDYMLLLTTNPRLRPELPPFHQLAQAQIDHLHFYYQDSSPSI